MISVFGFQFIQRIPSGLAARSSSIGGRLWKAGWADFPALTIASRIGRQGKMNILPKLRGQVNLFPSVQFLLHGKRIHNQIGFKGFHTGDTPQTYTNGQTTSGKNPITGDSHVERIEKWGDRNSIGLLKFQDGSILLSFEVEDLPLGDMVQVNFHLLGKFFLHPLRHGSGHKGGDIASQLGHFLDDAGTEESIILFWR